MTENISHIVHGAWNLSQEFGEHRTNITRCKVQVKKKRNSNSNLTKNKIQIQI
jgi:hypothetical protein